MTRTLWYDILSLFRPRLSSSREKLREKNWTHKVSFDTSLRVGGPSRPRSKSTFFSLMAHFEQNSFLTCCNGLKSILSESNIWKIRFHSQSLWYTHRFVIVNLAYLRYGKLEENWQRSVCNCGFNQNECKSMSKTGWRGWSLKIFEQLVFSPASIGGGPQGARLPLYTFLKPGPLNLWKKHYQL